MTDDLEPRPVVWRNLPTQVFFDGMRHLEDLTHELRLIESGDRTGVAEVPAELAGMVRELLSAYHSPHQDTWRQVREAADAGRETFDLTLALPPAALDGLRTLMDLLEQAEELCRRGVLMTMPPSEEVLALRRATFAEAERQLVASGGPVSES